MLHRNLLPASAFRARWGPSLVPFPGDRGQARSKSSSDAPRDGNPSIFRSLFPEKANLQTPTGKSKPGNAEEVSRKLRPDANGDGDSEGQPNDSISRQLFRNKGTKGGLGVKGDVAGGPARVPSQLEHNAPRAQKGSRASVQNSASAEEKHIAPGDRRGSQDVEEQQERRALLTISPLSKSLLESDFYRIGPQGKHMDGWNVSSIKRGT
jgi:hypothetical protein